MKKLSDPILYLKVGIEGYDGYDKNLIDLFCRLKAEEKKVKDRFTLFGYHRSPTRDYLVNNIKRKKAIDIIFVPNNNDPIFKENWTKKDIKKYKLKRKRDSRSWNRMEEINGIMKIPKVINIWSGKKTNYFGLIIKNIRIYSEGEFKLNISEYQHFKTETSMIDYNVRNPTLISKIKKRKRKKLVDVVATAKLVYPYTSQLFKK